MQELPTPSGFFGRVSMLQIISNVYLARLWLLFLRNVVISVGSLSNRLRSVWHKFGIALPFISSCIFSFLSSTFIWCCVLDSLHKCARHSRRMCQLLQKSQQSRSGSKRSNFHHLWYFCHSRFWWSWSGRDFAERVRATFPFRRLRCDVQVLVHARQRRHCRPASLS